MALISLDNVASALAYARERARTADGALVREAYADMVRRIEGGPTPHDPLRMRMLALADVLREHRLPRCADEAMAIAAALAEKQ
jgi:hypothetical protein